MAESVRLVLIAFAAATLVAAVALQFADHGSSDAWAAFSGVVGLLVGQHLDKPTRGLNAGWK
jgi:hypothetical protein